jgi:lipopolysaccharide export system permease protein
VRPLPGHDCNSVGRKAVSRLTCAMRLHDRYFFRELLTPLAFCLGGFLVFWISFFFFKEMGTIQEFTLFDTVAYCAASVPEFFVLVLPILLLLALLYALTHHARHNEITALRAAGISLWRLCAPYFVVGLVATGIYFALNEWAVPRCAEWSQAMEARYGKAAARSATKFIGSGFNNPRAHRLWKFDEYDAATLTMLKPKVYWTLPDHTERLLQAERAAYTNGVWTFYEAQFLVQTNAESRPVRQLHTNSIAMPEFDELPRRIFLELKYSDAQQLRAAHNPNLPLFELREYLQSNPNLTGKNANQLLTKFHGRIAAPWTCLVVVLIAIPFGAQPGRRNLFFGVAGSIFIGFAFFILQSVGLALGMGGHLPGWLAAWLPNIIFATTGVALIGRTR